MKFWTSDIKAAEALCLVGFKPDLHNDTFETKYFADYDKLCKGIEGRPIDFILWLQQPHEEHTDAASWGMRSCALHTIEDTTFKPVKRDRIFWELLSKEQRERFFGESDE